MILGRTPNLLQRISFVPSLTKDDGTIAIRPAMRAHETTYERGEHTLTIRVNTSPQRPLVGSELMAESRQIPVTAMDSE